MCLAQLRIFNGIPKLSFVLRTWKWKGRVSFLTWRMVFDFRIEDPKGTQEIMGNISRVLQSTGLLFDQTGVRIISGKEEAVSAWVSANYLLRYLHPVRHFHQTALHIHTVFRKWNFPPLRSNPHRKVEWSGRAAKHKARHSTFTVAECAPMRNLPLRTCTGINRRKKCLQKRTQALRTW